MKYIFVDDIIADEFIELMTDDSKRYQFIINSNVHNQLDNRLWAIMRHGRNNRQKYYKTHILSELISNGRILKQESDISINNDDAIIKSIEECLIKFANLSVCSKREAVLNFCASRGINTIDLDKLGLIIDYSLVNYITKKDDESIILTMERMGKSRLISGIIFLVLLLLNYLFGEFIAKTYDFLLLSVGSFLVALLLFAIKKSNVLIYAIIEFIFGITTILYIQYYLNNKDYAHIGKVINLITNVYVILNSIINISNYYEEKNNKQ